MNASVTSPIQVMPSIRRPDYSPETFAQFGAGYLPGHLGIEMLAVEPERMVCRVVVRKEILAPHGVVHGGTLVAIADTMCGYGAITHLPEGATGFVTIELHTNFLGAATGGAMRCTARPVHLGKTTQVWDAVVCDEATERTLAIFRCTQMVLRRDR